MKIGFYNPYFDSFGGGERYALTLASHWSKKHTVSVFWHDAKMLTEASSRFGLDLSRVIREDNFFASESLLSRLWKSWHYDVLFFVTDGSVPLTWARHNILHFQVPFAHVDTSFLRRSQFSAVVCNSRFTLDHIDPKFRDYSYVVYPPVSIDGLSASKGKKKHILSIGRFNGLYQAKKHEVMIEAFRQLYKEKYMKGWELVFAGSVLDSDAAYFRSLTQKASGLPIRFMTNVKKNELNTLYNQAEIYWHAAGFGETDPTKMEHFGIAIVEAMAAGAIPVAYNGGGIPEIIHDKECGFLWNTHDELLAITKEIVTHSKAYTKIREAAKARSKDFGIDAFCTAFDDVLQKIDTTQDPV